MIYFPLLSLFVPCVIFALFVDRCGRPRERLPSGFRILPQAKLSPLLRLLRRLMHTFICPSLYSPAVEATARALQRIAATAAVAAAAVAARP